jgi:hypothetical protein
MPRSSASGRLLAAAAALLLACSPAGDGAAGGDSVPDPAAAPAAQEGVRAVLAVDPATAAPGDSFAVTLTVVNATPDSVALEFTSGQRYDIRMLRPDGESVWTWSMDKLFAQMLGTETIAPGDTLAFRDSAPAPSEPGEYRVVAEVTAANRDLADTASVTVRR